LKQKVTNYCKAQEVIAPSNKHISLIVLSFDRMTSQIKIINTTHNTTQHNTTQYNNITRPTGMKSKKNDEKADFDFLETGYDSKS
jgi:hypothetical protein